jgi:hypothetical protein
MPSPHGNRRASRNPATWRAVAVADRDDGALRNAFPMRARHAYRTSRGCRVRRLMPKRPTQTSPLVEAALAFDEELAAYARLGELFVKSPLVSAKHLERATQTLGEVTACEERLAAAGQRLAQEVSAARDRQEGLAQAMVERLPALRERNERLAALLGELEALGAEAGALNASATETHQRGGAAAVAGELGDRMLALATRAEEVAARAREAQFDELASQAHALHQQLLAATKKLQAASLR